MSAVYALYTGGEAAQLAVDRLRAAGVPDGRITVITNEPMDAYEFARLHGPTRQWYAAGAGGIAGLSAGVWLARMTELAWPLPTGNMPIVSWWPNLIIVFELTMLGAILATVGTLIVTARLVRRTPALYDPAVSAGRILVGVDAPRDLASVERAFLSSGGEPTRV
jgi:hypothetical protein